MILKMTKYPGFKITAFAVWFLFWKSVNAKCEVHSYPAVPPRRPPWSGSWWHRCRGTSSHFRHAVCSESEGSSGLWAVAAHRDPSPWPFRSSCSHADMYPSSHQTQMLGIAHNLCQKKNRWNLSSLCIIFSWVSAHIGRRQNNIFYF